MEIAQEPQHESAKLLREARSIREKLGKMLQEPKYKPSLTVDAWTDCANRSYLAATVHIVGDNDLVLRSYVLGVRQITSRNHRSEVIRQELESLLGVFHVRIGNFTRIVTDNASSMVKAFAYKNSTGRKRRRRDSRKDDISEDSTDGEEENLDVYEFGNEDEFEEEDEFEDEKIEKVIQFDRDEDDFRLDDPLRVP
uniref:Uncharacterized protein n=1 Tax=Ditylenchus dipsaci TaxID=166011 RepID=A0A915ENQ5_9BILA